MQKLGLLAAVVAVALALVGCGGGGGDSGSETVTLGNSESMTKSKAIDLLMKRAPAAFKLVCTAIEKQGEDTARKSFEQGFQQAFRTDQISAGEVFEAAAERC